MSAMASEWRRAQKRLWDRFQIAYAMGIHRWWHYRLREDPVGIIIEDYRGVRVD